MLEYDNQRKRNSCTVRLTVTRRWNMKINEEQTGLHGPAVWLYWGNGIWITTKIKQVEQYSWRRLEYEKQRKTGWRWLEYEKQWKTGWRWLEYEKQVEQYSWRRLEYEKQRKTNRLHSTADGGWNMRNRLNSSVDERWNMRNRLNSSVDGGWNMRNNEKQVDGGWNMRNNEKQTGWTVRLTAVEIWETMKNKTAQHGWRAVQRLTLTKHWDMKTNEKQTGFTVRLTKRCAFDSNETLEYENRWKTNRFHSVVGWTWKSGQELTNHPSERQKEAPEPVISVNRQKDRRESRWRGRAQEHSLSNANGLLLRSSVATYHICEPVWPGGKALSWEAEGPDGLDSASALLSLQKRLWFVDTVSWLCPSQLMKH